MQLSRPHHQPPPNIQLQQDPQGFLWLHCSCFSWRFLPNLLLIPLFGAIGALCLVAGSPNWITRIAGILLGLLFWGVALLNIKYAWIYLWGRLELHLSQEGGQLQWYWGKWPLGKKQLFYWQDLESIHLGQAKRAQNKKDVLLVLKGTEKLFLRNFLSYHQLSYLEGLLSYLLEEYEKGSLDLAPNWGEHLLE